MKLASPVGEMASGEGKLEQEGQGDDGDRGVDLLDPPGERLQRHSPPSGVGAGSGAVFLRRACADSEFLLAIASSLRPTAD